MNIDHYSIYMHKHLQCQCILLPVSPEQLFIHGHNRLLLRWLVFFSDISISTTADCSTIIKFTQELTYIDKIPLNMTNNTTSDIIKIRYWTREYCILEHFDLGVSLYFVPHCSQSCKWSCFLFL